MCFLQVTANSDKRSHVRSKTSLSILKHRRARLQDFKLMTVSGLQTQDISLEMQQSARQTSCSKHSACVELSESEACLASAKSHLRTLVFEGRASRQTFHGALMCPAYSMLHRTAKALEAQSGSVCILAIGLAALPSPKVYE